MQNRTSTRGPGSVRRNVSSAAIARTFAEVNKVNTAALVREMGIPGGTLDDNGLTVEAYNPNLQGQAWFQKVDEMLVASSQAAVVELCWCLPVVSTEWAVVGGSQELNDLCTTALLSPAGMSTTWPEVCYNAALSALYGTAFFEIVWKELNGALTFGRLVDRDVSSIERYEWDADGGLKSVVQKGKDPDSGDEVEVALPIEKCLLFPFRGRRRELHGRSILRPAYRHYFSLDMVVRFADIGLDHSLVGVPIGKSPSNAKPSDRATFLSILRALRRHEASGLVLPPGWDIIDGRQIGGSDKIGFLDYIQWHEGAFLRTALANYMQLGSTKSGTTELSGDLIQFQTMGLGALAAGIASRVERHGLRRLCDANATVTNEDDYPRFEYRPIADLFRSGQAGQFAQALADGQVPIPEGKDQQAAMVRDGLGLPDGDTRKVGAPAPNKVGAPKTASGQPKAADTAVVKKAREADEGHRHFAEPSPPLADWQTVMERHLTDALASLQQQAAAADGDQAMLASLAVPAAIVDRWTESIADWLAGVREEALQVIEEETGVADPHLHQVDPTDAERARARVIARHLADEAVTEVSLAALDGADAGGIAGRFAEQVSSTLRADLHAGAQTVTKAVADATA